jgi:hypothetical protein
MNKCVDRDIQEMLPDLLHRTLRSEDRERAELHVATCESCREDLAVIRAVKGAAIFTPPIDVGQIVRQIPPYTPIVPEVRAPARNRVTQWLVAATVAVAVIGGGSLVMDRQSTPASPIAATGTAGAVNSIGSAAAPVSAGASQVAPAHTFALAADVASLSDGDLVQLMSDMDDFDALPATEPEPIISVDSGEDL